MPEPGLDRIADALATRASPSLFELVKARFTGNRKATRALIAVEGAAPGSRKVRALIALLEETEAADPDFVRQLRGELPKTEFTQRAEVDGVINHVSGTVTGNLVQARDIRGGIRFGP